MSQDNIQTDTPQQPNQTEFASLEEAVFGHKNEDPVTITDAFTVGDSNQSASTNVEQPEETSQGVNNDTARYQYWQSEADKAKNELTQVKQAYEQLASQGQAQAPVQQEAVQEEPLGVESFPEAPMKPTRPNNFNREEALADSSSESARYMDAVESWRDDMNEYGNLKNQYQASILQDRLDNMEQQKVQEAQRFEHNQQISQKTNEVKNYVMGHHGLSDADANHFISTMSDPASVNIDNLVQLYRMNSGKTAPQPAQPSDNFKQLQNAQQVPSPMGVMPSGQSSNDGRSFEDKMIDTMIGDFNSKNPWK